MGNKYSLIDACLRRDINASLEILKHIDKCNLGHINKYGDTVLIFACHNNMSVVALEILKHVDKCNLGQTNVIGNTALIFACDNKMLEVALEILKHIDKCNLGQINKDGDTALILAKKNNMLEVVKIIKERLRNSLDNKEIEKEIMQIRINNKKCLFCGDDTKDSILYSECNHAFISCNNCRPRLLNKICPICRSTGNIIKKLYLCT